MRGKYRAQMWTRMAYLHKSLVMYFISGVTCQALASSDVTNNHFRSWRHACQLPHWLWGRGSTEPRDRAMTGATRHWHGSAFGTHHHIGSDPWSCPARDDTGWTVHSAIGRGVAYHLSLPWLGLYKCSGKMTRYSVHYTNHITFRCDKHKRNSALHL